MPLAPVHRHLLEMTGRSFLCACDPCALRFQDVVDGKFRLIPRDARTVPGFCMTDAHWEGLALPINPAFFFHNSASGRVVAMYPSPAGAMESLLPLANWKSLVSENPELASMASDVESLLVHRVGMAREYFIAPIDRRYELVGLIRTHWRGSPGGETVWREIAKFFAGLREQAGVNGGVAEVNHA